MMNNYCENITKALGSILGLLILVFFLQTAEASKPTKASNTELQAWSKTIDSPKRFVILNSFNEEAVLDRETQLVWQREPKSNESASFFRTNILGAVRHCYAVTTGNRMGWRLPTAEELTSLLVGTLTQSGTLRAALPQDHPFIGITSERYWSITTGNLSGENGHFVVAMNEPEISTVGLEANPNVIHPTWCVRGHGGGQSAVLP